MIKHLDHFVLTVKSIAATCDFYRRALGFEAVTFEGRTALQFGAHRINLHELGKEFSPRAAKPTPGSGDFCLLADRPIEDVMAHLEGANITIEEGPVARTGAAGALRSIYFRDPDGNLIEVSNPTSA
jgi:catechol 2,3-dioxygenase-like lactoylglutathione lyase family enzyme